MSVARFSVGFFVGSLVAGITGVVPLDSSGSTVALFVSLLKMVVFP